MAALRNGSTPTDSARVSPLGGMFADIAEASLVDLPLAAMKRVIGRADDLEVNEATWKAYDATVLATQATTEAIQRSPQFANALSSATELALQWQRLNTSITRALFSTVWPAVGLPSNNQIQELRKELRDLRAEVTAVRAEAVIERRATEEVFARSPLGRHEQATLQFNRSEGKTAKKGNPWTDWKITPREANDDVRN